MPEETTGQEATSDNTEGTTFDFETWLSEQPDTVRGGYENHTAKLKRALEEERSQRKEFTKQLRELTGKAEEGSEAKKALDAMSSRAEQAEQRAAFYESAGRPEIGCTNPKAAFLVAQAEGLFTRSGEPDWTAIKTQVPEFFTRKVPPGNAGNGHNAPAAPAADMNAFIRTAAGRG